MSIYNQLKSLDPGATDEEVNQGLVALQTQYPGLDDVGLMQKAIEHHADYQKQQSSSPEVAPMQLNNPVTDPTSKTQEGLLASYSPEARDSAQKKADSVNNSTRNKVGNALTIFAEGFKKNPDLAGAISQNRQDAQAIDDKYVGNFDKAKANAVQDYSLNKTIKADEKTAATEKVKKDPTSAYSANKRLIAQKYDPKNKDKYKGMSGEEIDALLPDIKDIRTLDDKKEIAASNAELKRLILQDKKNKEESKPSEAEKYVDRGFGKDYADYVAGGGYASVKKNIDQLKSAATQLGSKDGPNVSGGLLGLVPKGARDVITPKGAAVQDAIEQTILTTLRQTLGAQFTENEGKRVLAYAFNPRQSEEENLVRVNRLIDQLENQAKAKAAAAQYYEEKGTLSGYKGPAFASRAEDLFDEPKKSENKKITEQDVDNMSLEELKAHGLI